MDMVRTPRGMEPGLERTKNSPFGTSPKWNLFWETPRCKGLHRKSVFTHDYQVLRVCLTKHREAAGLTQIDVAKRIDETQSYCQNANGGSGRLDLVQLRMFCRAIGMTLTDFVKEFERGPVRLTAGSEDNLGAVQHLQIAALVVSRQAVS